MSSPPSLLSLLLPPPSHPPALPAPLLRTPSSNPAFTAALAASRAPRITLHTVVGTAFSGVGHGQPAFFLRPSPPANSLPPRFAPARPIMRAQFDRDHDGRLSYEDFAWGCAQSRVLVRLIQGIFANDIAPGWDAIIPAAPPPVCAALPSRPSRLLLRVDPSASSGDASRCALRWRQDSQPYCRGTARLDYRRLFPPMRVPMAFFRPVPPECTGEGMRVRQRKRSLARARFHAESHRTSAYSVGVRRGMEQKVGGGRTLSRCWSTVSRCIACTRTTAAYWERTLSTPRSGGGGEGCGALGRSEHLQRRYHIILFLSLTRAC